MPGAKVTAIDCDLMDFESVRAAAAAIAKVPQKLLEGSRKIEKDRERSINF